MDFSYHFFLLSPFISSCLISIMAVLAVITRMRLSSDEHFHSKVFKKGCKRIRNWMSVMGVKNAQHQLIWPSCLILSFHSFQLHLLLFLIICLGFVFFLKTFSRGPCSLWSKPAKLHQFGRRQYTRTKVIAFSHLYSIRMLHDF